MGGIQPTLFLRPVKGQDRVMAPKVAGRMPPNVTSPNLSVRSPAPAARATAVVIRFREIGDRAGTDQTACSERGPCQLPTSAHRDRRFRWRSAFLLPLDFDPGLPSGEYLFTNADRPWQSYGLVTPMVKESLTDEAQQGRSFAFIRLAIRKFIVKPRHRISLRRSARG
jgi:hypothetical protein